MEEWWSRKCDKARECTFTTITADEISMLELIRGVNSTKLRQKFLKQKDPTLDKLLQIAKNWQVTEDVEKGMESAVESRKTSSYQQDKSKKWQGKSGTDSAKGKVDNTNPNQSNQVLKCGWCGKKSHPRDQCPARDKDCTKCGRKGHFQAVCRSSDGGARGRFR